MSQPAIFVACGNSCFCTPRPYTRHRFYKNNADQAPKQAIFMFYPYRYFIARGDSLRKTEQLQTEREQPKKHSQPGIKPA